MTTDKAPYFYAAYGIVWLALMLYVAWIGTRVRALEERIGRTRAP